LNHQGTKSTKEGIVKSESLGVLGALVVHAFRWPIEPLIADNYNAAGFVGKARQ
jgi:hypothetical protein